jgi:hypothetical protein
VHLSPRHTARDWIRRPVDKNVRQRPSVDIRIRLNDREVILRPRGPVTLDVAG